MEIAITGNYTDLYQIAMGQACFRDGLADKRACFDYFFRKFPFDCGYVVFAGLDDALEVLESWHFSAGDIDYLAARGFDPEYLAYLRTLRFRGWRCCRPNTGGSKTRTSTRSVSARHCKSCAMHCAANTCN